MTVICNWWVLCRSFIDQSISANTNYDPSRFPSGKVPMQQLLKDLLTAYKFWRENSVTIKIPATARKMRRTIWRLLFRTMAAKAARVRI
nr:Ribonucleotide reductase of class Ia (aerobic)alpha subunit [Salmonella sp. NCTC 7297]